MVEDAVVREIAVRVADVTEEQIKAVLEAWVAVKEGPELGTVVIDEKTGAVAVRVSEEGIHLWHVSALDGSRWVDMQPTLSGWGVLRTP